LDFDLKVLEEGVPGGAAPFDGGAVSLRAKGAADHHVAMRGNGSASRLQFGTVTIIPEERLVLKDGRPVPLTPKAFDLLVVLATNPGRLLTKEHLMEAVWPDAIVEESNLAYHVYAIRKALGENSDADRSIETVPKRGYRFVAPVAQVGGDDSGFSSSAQAASGTLQQREAIDLAVADEADGQGLADYPTDQRAGINWRPWLGLTAGVVLGALILLVLGRARSPAVPNASVHFQEPVTGRMAETGMFSVSPDGRHLVFAAEGADGILRLWARTMHTLDPAPLQGTEVFTIIPPVVWSPDSRFVAFDPGWLLKKASLAGGSPQSLCELPSTAVGGSWNRDGDILLGNAAGGLVRCPASGGRATIVTAADLSTGERHLFPSFLSDGRHFIYLRISRANPETSGIYAGELGVEAPKAGNRLITTGFGAAFVRAADSRQGVIVFARDGALFAQRFDERRLAVAGEPMRLADRVGSYLDGAFFSVSARTLVYRAPEPDSRLAWFDRQGRELGRIGTPARFSGLALSPDGDRALVTTHAPQGTANADLWLFDMARTASPRRITFGPALEFWPVWSTNDQFVFGSAGGSSGVHQQTVGGDRQLLFDGERPEIPTSMSADGRIVLYSTITQPSKGSDVWVRIGKRDSAKSTPFLQGEKHELQAQLSPDNSWVAYVSNEAGPNEVYVTGFRFNPVTGAVSAGERIRISEGGGVAPRWRRDGRELFYLTPDGSVMSIEIDRQNGFRPGSAKRLFTVPGAIPEWGVTPDGARFLFAVPVSAPPPFDIVQDWQSSLPN
jgi:DNA-binding winged helix-turn-helix (wHTH) protein/Tol biopolymer transport system component